MAIQISLYLGKEALSLIEDKQFQSEWENLAKSDSKDTHLQESAFVTAWYQTYLATYQPLILVGYNPQGEKVGLMFLAQHQSNGNLVHAGNEQAEYHGWISQANDNQSFLLACFLELRTQLSLKKWTWQWMPRGTSLSELPVQALKKNGIYLTYESQAVPYWNFEDTNKLKKLLKSRSFKSKVNRYKRRGDLRLQKIESQEDFQAILPDLAFQTDIRKEATYDSRPFADDENKGAFMTQLFAQPQTHHCTVLFLDQKPIAIHFGTEDGAGVHLGTISYDPTESRQSPGTILMIMLGELLQQEGFQYMDLTPGTDTYKHRFSNEFIEHIRPSFYFSKAQHHKGKLKIFGVTKIKSFVTKYGDPQKMRIKIADYKESFQKIKSQPKSWIRSKIKRLTGKIDKVQLLAINQDSILSFTSIGGLNSQHYQDLFLYPHQLEISRRALFSEALSRFQAGDQLFSLQQSKQLQAIIWNINFTNTKIQALNPQYQELQEADIVLRVGYWENSYSFQNFGPLLASILQAIPTKPQTKLYLEWPLQFGKIPSAIEQLAIPTPKAS